MPPLLLALLAGAVHAHPAPTPIGAPAEWKRFAECAAAHYADADIIDLNRTAPKKAAIMDLGRRYGAMARALRHSETGDPKGKADAYTKAYIVELTRNLAQRTRPDLQPIIDACPNPPS